MAKAGDRVRFLNATGGGIIKSIDGKNAVVEDEDGFETPVLLKDIVVVLPAGHEASLKNASIMFDQKAFDEGRKQHEVKPQKEIKQIPESKLEKIVETSYGDNPSVSLVFEPQDIKRLSQTGFAAVLVNDSNYWFDFSFLRRADDNKGWVQVYHGTINPNELIDLAVVNRESLPGFERVALQGFFYKTDKEFSLFQPVSSIRHLDLTKFHKLHCFQPGMYFDSPVLEFPLLKQGEVVKELDLGEIQKIATDKEKKNLIDKFSEKYKTDQHKSKSNNGSNDASNPHKKLPLIEVDLHISELLDSTAGMEPADMLERQLEEVRKTMNAHSKRIGQKIVFIHGKGEGVLRNAVIKLLKKEFPKAEIQDASFREYGFGASLITIH